MLFLGMGTEVFVFVVSGFERVTEKVPNSGAASGAALSSETIEELANVASAAAQNVGNGGGGGGTVVIGGGMPAGGGTVVIGGGSVGTELPTQGDGEAAPVVTGGGAAIGGQPVILGGGVVGGAGLTEAAQLQATDPATVEEAVKNYAEQLTELTEVLGRVKKQAERMSTDSEEMENLNRTLTGIATVYELQLRNISKQVTTIEQIDEQTRRMAQQIEELNNVYARMIQALTVNMSAPVTPAAPVAPAMPSEG